jgi:hypothetical protein
MATPLVFVGIDVVQAILEVAVRPTGEARQVANEEIASADLVERVRQLKPALIDAGGNRRHPRTRGCGAGRVEAAACASQFPGKRVYRSTYGVGPVLSAAFASQPPGTRQRL